MSSPPTPRPTLFCSPDREAAGGVWRDNLKFSWISILFIWDFFVLGFGFPWCGARARLYSLKLWKFFFSCCAMAHDSAVFPSNVCPLHHQKVKYCEGKKNLFGGFLSSTNPRHDKWIVCLCVQLKIVKISETKWNQQTDNEKKREKSHRNGCTHFDVSEKFKRKKATETRGKCFGLFFFLLF